MPSNWDVVNMQYFGGRLLAAAQGQVQQAVHDISGMARGAQVLGFRVSRCLLQFLHSFAFAL